MVTVNTFPRKTHWHFLKPLSVSQGLKWSKVLSLILVSLLGRVCSSGTSHVFSFEKKAVSLKRTGNSTLLKWIVMYAWQALIMRLVSGCIKEEMLEIREELIRSHFLWLNSFLPRFLRNFAFLFIIGIYSSHLVILSSSIDTGTQF